MSENLVSIQKDIKEMLLAVCPPLQARKDSAEGFEVAGTKPAIQGKAKVDGFYFASIVPKPKDIRFYFFPIYTHVDAYKISPALKKSQKGKSCFHIKKMDDAIKEEIHQMILKGVQLYQKEGWI